MTTSPDFRGRQHDARSLALQVLLGSLEHEAFVQDLLDVQLTRHPLSAPDRRLATQLVYGVLRRHGTLRALLQPFVRRPAQNVEPWLWQALYLGAFQLVFLSHVPAHAALNETVQLAFRFGRPGARGFINGVLRSLSRTLTDEVVDQPGPAALPLEPGRYRRLTQPVLPDPSADPVQYLAVGHSLPVWLARRWSERYPLEECTRLGFWLAGPGRLTLRCNPLRTSREALLERIRARDIPAEAGQHPQGILLGELLPVREIPGYEEGHFCVQDESAMFVASAVAPAPGERVLDLCAAPGGKSTHLAELMGDQGEVVACDIDERRLARVEETARRLGLGSVRPRHIEPGREESIPAGPFDAALVDAPCSNTGVLGRRPEARWRLKPEDLRELVPLQTRLLLTAVQRVRPGGRVVYSTCSIEPEENGGVVRAAVQFRAGLRLEEEQQLMPGRPADGGYWARLRRE